MSFAKYIKLLRSAFEPYHFDWLKVLRYISQLPFMCLPSSHILLPHLQELVFAWRLLGEKVGFSDHDHTALLCSYDRCPGFEVVNWQSLACGKCLYTNYCSTRCQQGWVFFPITAQAIIEPPIATGCMEIVRIASVATGTSEVQTLSKKSR